MGHFVYINKIKLPVRFEKVNLCSFFMKKTDSSQIFFNPHTVSSDRKIMLENILSPSFQSYLKKQTSHRKGTNYIMPFTVNVN